MTTRVRITVLEHHTPVVVDIVQAGKVVETHRISKDKSEFEAYIYLNSVGGQSLVVREDFPLDKQV